MMMDIDRILKQTVDKDNKRENLIAFNRSTGVRESLNEHLVPEQLFDDPNTDEKEVEGISAVKALQIASTEGQMIYHITKDNYNQILPKLSLSSHVMSDIRNAISAGREVTAHEKNIRVNGWSGSGYIIIDPQTGSGAYLIDGGANGGFLNWVDAGWLAGIGIGIGLQTGVPAIFGNSFAVITNKYLSFSGKMQALAEIITGKDNTCLSEEQKNSFSESFKALGLLSTLLTPIGFGSSRAGANVFSLTSEPALVLAYSFIVIQVIHLSKIEYYSNGCELTHE